MITIIVAMDEHRLIGQNGHLPWHIKEDLQHFRKETINKTLLMGRKTYESFKAPLPNRKHIVVSSNYNPSNNYPDVIVVKDIIPVLKHYQKSEEELMVIGGASVYAQAFPYADKVILSLIKGKYEGDTYLPMFEDKFVIESIQQQELFTILCYQRCTNVSA